jgi:GT2 family glycosyltransferase
VSAVIVNYRSYGELGRCLASLSADVDAGVLEVIVVDNASTPASLAPVVQTYTFAAFLPRADNPGFGAAVNQAARQARGDFLLLVNPDAIVQPGAVGRLMAYLDAQPDTALVGPRVYDIDGHVQGSARSFPGLLTGLFGRTSLLTRLWPANPISRHNLPVDVREDQPRDVDWVAASCLMVRADAFRAVGGFDTRYFMYWEDADLCHELRSRGWRIVYLPSAGVVHQVGGSSRYASARSTVAFHRSAFRYYAKHRHGAARYPLLAIAAAALGVRLIARLLRGYLERDKPFAPDVSAKT